MQYQIKVCKFLIIKIMRDFLAKTKNNNQCSIINKFMYEKLCDKSSTLKTINWTVILIFPRYRTHLLICCAVYSKVWWYSEKCPDNWIVARKYVWFRTARLVRQNNDCVMCFCILWCKNVMYSKKINMMNLWL